MYIQNNMNKSRICQNFSPREAFFCIIRVRGSLISTKKFGLLKEGKKKCAQDFFYWSKKILIFFFFFLSPFFHVFFQTLDKLLTSAEKCAKYWGFFISFITSKRIFDEKTKKKGKVKKILKKRCLAGTFIYLYPRRQFTSANTFEIFNRFGFAHCILLSVGIQIFLWAFAFHS